MILITGKLLTVTVTTFEIAEGHGLLVTTALKYFVTVNAPIVAAGKVAVVTPVPVILVKVILSEEDCHCMVPKLPAKVIFAGVNPEQILWFADAVPDNEVEIIVTLPETALVVTHPLELVTLQK